MRKRRYRHNSDDFSSPTKKSASISTITSQASQSEPTAEDLFRIMAKLMDSSSVIDLVGKMDSLLIQSIVCDIYTDWESDPSKMVENIWELQKQFLIKAGYKKEECYKNMYPSELAQLLQSMLADIIKKPFTIKCYTLSEEIRDGFVWIENLETLNKFLKGSFQPSDQTELKEMALGLMYNLIFMIYDRHYSALIKNVPGKFLSNYDKYVKMKQFRHTRHDIVHCRPNHDFKDEKERNNFLTFYEKRFKKFIKDQDCFCLEDRNKARLFYTVIIYL